MYRPEDPSSSGDFARSASFGASGSQRDFTQDDAGEGNGLKEKARDAAEEVQFRAADLKDQATEQATGRLEDRKGQAAETIVSLAGALRQTGEQLREQDQQNFAQYADQAAQQVERFASYLREQDVSQMFDEVERFARRQPLLFMGGTFALGMLAARFLKASRPESYGNHGNYQSYSTSGYGSTSRTEGHRTGYGASTGTGTGTGTGFSAGSQGGYSESYAPRYGQPGGSGIGSSGAYLNRETMGTERGGQGDWNTGGLASSSRGADYPDIDTGQTSQGYMGKPGGDRRNTGYPGGESATGATGSGTGEITRPTGGAGSYREQNETETPERWRDPNATE